METRVVVEYKVYLLYLNPMRRRIEAMDLVAFADSKDTLMSWYNSQKTEPYYDTSGEVQNEFGDDRKWYKCFKKGSQLEWYNEMCQDCQIQERWVSEEIFKSLESRYYNASNFINNH